MFYAEFKTIFTNDSKDFFRIRDWKYTDPAELPRPESITPQQVPEKPKALNLFTDAVAPLREEGREVINIRVSESMMMERARQCGATPASWLSVLLCRAVSRLHPDFSNGVPTVSMAVNLRKAINTPLAHQPMVGSFTIPFSQTIARKSMKEQVKDCRQWIALQTQQDNLRAYYYGMQDGMTQLEQVPSLEMRHELLSQRLAALSANATVSLSYVGRADMGAAERYVREIQTESPSLYAVLVEVSAVNGSFCISFIQQFAADDYLEAFLAELGQQGMAYEIADRHMVLLAPLADFRKSI